MPLRSAFVIVCGVLLIGCGSRPSVQKTPAQTDLERKWTGVKSKLETMTPDQRAKYIREHPEEIKQLGG